MAQMGKISEAILSKVRVEAGNKVLKTKLLEEKAKMIEEAKWEATRILAQASIKTRLELLAAKTEIIGEIISRVKNLLSGSLGDKASPLPLIKEAISTLGVDKARVNVSPKDVSTVQKLVSEDKGIADKAIDNSYETRLEMLLPKLLPEINKELFQG